MDTLQGTIERLIFHNTDTGFSIFVLTVHAQSSVLVKAHIAHIHPGEEVYLQGSWVFHKKFGKQFEATTCSARLPTSIVGLKKYLASGVIKGIGPTYAEKLVKYFGTDILTIIEHTPERLLEIEGIGPKRIEKIQEGFKNQKEISHIIIFLQEKEISPTYAAKIYKAYGTQALAIVHENPYRLADDIWGIGFKTADTIAQKLGFDPYSSKRIESAISYIISQIAQQGHLYIELQDLKAKVCDLITLAAEHHDTIKSALHNLYNRAKIKVITYQEEHYITLTQYYFSEFFVAQKINKLLEYRSSLIFDLEKITQELDSSTHSNMYLNDDQKHSIITCLRNKITIITGGPGTGKTTVIKKLLSILDNNTTPLRYKLAAPTGRAAKRITEGTGKHAVTLHRLLEFDVATMSFTHNENNALALDFLIIDEASMIDIFLAHALLKAIPFTAHIVFIGDIDQLPSVGAGNFLNDLIASGKAACVKLTQIFRQARDSLIIINAHRINNGEFPLTFSKGSPKKRDFIFIKENDPERIEHHLTEIYTQELPKYTIKPDNTQVLVPMNRGIVGTHTLNHYLQKLLNPEDTVSCIHAGTLFKLGDRVMQIRNNYDKLVFNGDIGVITNVNIYDQIIQVQFGERAVEYEQNELDELVLAYAISIHKSQGSEYPAAIIPIFMQHYTLLQRNLIYTAITRAKKLCIVIGQTKALAMAIGNNTSIQRRTFLQQFLTTSLEARS